MGRVMLQTFLGILALIAGIYLLYLSITGLNTGGFPWMLLVSFLLFGAAVFCFVRAGKSDATVMTKADVSAIATETDDHSKEAPANILNRNNEMIKQYNQTAKAREELKMLELSSAGKPEA